MVDTRFLGRLLLLNLRGLSPWLPSELAALTLYSCRHVMAMNVTARRLLIPVAILLKGAGVGIGGTEVAG